jgi:hypothetical protein
MLVEAVARPTTSTCTASWARRPTSPAPRLSSSGALRRDPRARAASRTACPRRQQARQLGAAERCIGRDENSNSPRVAPGTEGRALEDDVVPCRSAITVSAARARCPGRGVEEAARELAVEVGLRAHEGRAPLADLVRVRVGIRRLVGVDRPAVAMSSACASSSRAPRRSRRTLTPTVMWSESSRGAPGGATRAAGDTSCRRRAAPRPARARRAHRESCSAGSSAAARHGLVHQPALLARDLERDHLVGVVVDGQAL